MAEPDAAESSGSEPMHAGRPSAEDSSLIAWTRRELMQVGRASNADHRSASSSVEGSREDSAATRGAMHVFLASNADHRSRSASVEDSRGDRANRGAMHVFRASNADHRSDSRDSVTSAAVGWAPRRGTLNTRCAMVAVPVSCSSAAEEAATRAGAAWVNFFLGAFWGELPAIADLIAPTFSADPFSFGAFSVFLWRGEGGFSAATFLTAAFSALAATALSRSHSAVSLSATAAMPVTAAPFTAVVLSATVLADDAAFAAAFSAAAFTTANAFAVATC